MKRTLTFIIVIVIGWLCFSYFSATWKRTQFISEVDSLLGTPRTMNQNNLPDLVLNKARQFGIEIKPEDVLVQITTTNQKTKTGRRLEGKGFTADTRRLTLKIVYEQSVLGMKKTYTLDRTRIFTQKITPSQYRSPQIQN